jgi:hypothetical protein
MEVYGDLEVLDVPEAVSHLFDLLDLVVEPLSNGVGETMLGVGQDVGEVTLEHVGHLPDRLQARVGGPPEPPLEESKGVAWADVPMPRPK